jgi:hypothetical protein
MLRFKSRRPSAAMLVALLALFVGSAGGAYAANVINGKNIQNGTIKASKLKANTLTGSQIDESALSQVPNANHADTATNAKHADSVDEVANALQADVAANALNLGGVAAAKYLRGVHLVTNTSLADSTTKTVTAVCPGNEVALGGGGNNTAPTGVVTFDRMQLEPHSFTVTEFEVNGGTGGAWVAEAEVVCAVP